MKKAILYPVGLFICSVIHAQQINKDQQYSTASPKMLHEYFRNGHRNIESKVHAIRHISKTDQPNTETISEDNKQQSPPQANGIKLMHEAPKRKVISSSSPPQR